MTHYRFSVPTRGGAVTLASRLLARMGALAAVVLAVSAYTSHSAAYAGQGHAFAVFGHSDRAQLYVADRTPGKVWRTRPAPVPVQPHARPPKGNWDGSWHYVVPPSYWKGPHGYHNKHSHPGAGFKSRHYRPYRPDAHQPYRPDAHQYYRPGNHQSYRPRSYPSYRPRAHGPTWRGHAWRAPGRPR